MELRDLKVGYFVRTKKGIAKIIDRILDPTHYYFKMWVTDTYLELNDDTEYICEKDIIKASDKLIDLVEIGDYVNGSKVANIVEEDCIQYLVLDRDEVYYDNCLEPSSDKDIKSIVTKEQFDQMSYKVGE